LPTRSRTTAAGSRTRERQRSPCALPGQPRGRRRAGAPGSTGPGSRSPRRAGGSGRRRRRTWPSASWRRWSAASGAGDRLDTLLRLFVLRLPVPVAAARSTPPTPWRASTSPSTTRSTRPTTSGAPAKAHSELARLVVEVDTRADHADLGPLGPWTRGARRRSMIATAYTSPARGRPRATRESARGVGRRACR
jgi:hypothetical protein